MSPWLILAFPAALLVGFAFAAVGMAATTSFMRTWQDFDLIQLVILPLFLFSATFYPLETYPEALQWVVRIAFYQGVDLIRSLAVRAISPVLLVHVAYLTAMGLIGLAITNRRLGKLLLKAWQRPTGRRWRR